jgi:hypothetical protein
MEHWQSQLETLKARFESAAAQHRGFGCLLLHAGPEYHECLKYPPEIQVKDFPLAIGGSIYGDHRRPYCLRNVFLPRAREPALRFGELAEDAARCLDGVPPDVLRSIPADTLRTNGDLRWVFLVFDMASQAGPGSLLHAEKVIWWGCPSKRRKDGKRIFDQKAHEESKRIFDAGPPPRDRYCRLLVNIFSASADTIGLLLAQRDGDVDDGDSPKLSEAAIIVDHDASKIVVNGNPHDAELPWCSIVQSLIDADGDYVTGPAMNNLKGCRGKKISNVIKAMESAIPDLTAYVLHEGNKGYRLLKSPK